MQRKKSQALMVMLLVPLILVVDQAIKIAVKTSMYMHESRRVTDWFYILFTENRGMAFGIELFDKLFLTSFRIVAVVALTWYIVRRIRQGVQWGFLVCLTLILAGAAGNIFDCLFYGMVFNDPVPPQVAHFVPWGTGYAPVMMGRVVDMFYFPLVE
jgi:signal peptidase II